MLASLAALHWDASGYSFRLSFGVIVAFIVGAASGYSYWQLIARGNSARGGKKKAGFMRLRSIVAHGLGRVSLPATIPARRQIA